MAQEKKSAGFNAVQRLINEMAANRTIGTDYNKNAVKSKGQTNVKTNPDEYVNKRLSQLGLNHSDVDDNFITVFLSDAKKYLDSAESDYSSMGFANSSSIYESRKKATDDLRSRSWKVRQYLGKNKTAYKPEDYEELVSYLDAFDKASSQSNYAFYRNKGFYSKFDTQEQYDFWETHSTVENRQKWYAEQQSRLEKLKAEKKSGSWLQSSGDYDVDSREYKNAAVENAARLQALNDEIASIEAEIRNYERGNFNEDGQYYGSKVVDDYHALTKRGDFSVTSANRDHYNPTREELAKSDAMNDSSMWYFDANGVYRDAYGNELKADESGNWVNPNAKGSVVDRLGMFMNSSEGERQEALGTPLNMEGTWESVIKDGEDGSWDQLTENEIAIYYYLLNSDGQETADKYLSDMKTELNRRDTMAGKERLTAAFDEANALEKIALSVATVPAQLFSGAAGMIENTANTLMGNEINPYSAAHSGTHFSNTARGLQAEELDETGIAIPLIDFSLGDAYQAGMSILDSYAAIGIGGNLGGALLATSAASGEATRLYEQGASMGQIAVGSAAAGAAEMVFESLSIDKLINMKDAETVGQMIKNALVQGGIEASEEGFTEIANILTNAIIMGSESDWEKLVEENGGDKWKAFLSEVQTVAHSAFSGFLSGMGSASVPSAVSYAGTQSQYIQTGKDIIAADGGVDALKALAMDVSGAGSKLTKQANKVTGETITGEGFGKVTAAIKNRSNQKAVGKLYRSVETAVSSQNQSDIAKALEESGFSAKSAKHIAEAIVAKANGAELSNFQKSTLESVKDNKKVEEIVDKLYTDMDSSVSKRNLNLDVYSLGIKNGVGIAPNASEQITENADKASARKYTVSENGKLMNTETNEAIDHPVLAQAEDGTYKLVDENVGLVSNENVSYADHDQGIVVESFVKLSEDFGNVNKVIASMDLASRNKLLSLYNSDTNPDGGMFVNGVLDAYFYGHRGVDLSVAKKDSPINKLTEQQRQIAWETGRAAGEKATTAEQSNVDTTYAQAQKVLEQTGKKKGTYHATLEAGISHFNLTPEQKVVYNVAEEIAQGIQTNIRVYNGTNTAQGFYNHETDEILLNLNAANKGRDAIMAFTLAHEIVHRAKKGSPAKYQAFTEFLMKEYGKQGSDVEAMIQEQMDAAERFNKTVPKAKQIVMTEEKALEEVVCDACATMLLDTNAGQKLAEFGAQSKENRGFLEDLKRWISDLLERLRNYFKGIDPKSDAAREFAKFEENVKQTLANMYVEMATEAGEKLSTIKATYGGLDSVLKKNAEAITEDAILTEGAVVTDGERSYSIKSMKADIAEGKMFEDLKNVCGWTQRQVNELKQSLEDLVEYMTPFRDILDMNETYGREGRRFSPYKPNSDPLYKISMDFSTLCSKRLLTQYVIENLQLRENRPMSAEEQMAIRDMLNEYRKVEKGLQVACAMCYVEAARLKSPKQINKWLADPATQMKNYFADKDPEFANHIKEKQADFKESRGYARNATKKDMSAKDVRELNKIRPRVRSQYQVSEEEAKIIERAKSLPSSTYLTAGNLASLSETDPVIYSAYTAFVRTATRSKSLETDEPYYYGDSTRDNGNGIVVSDSFIEAVNRENGMRFSSWSDWRIQHLLDYITAVIDNSVRGAAMHGYTKFGDEVRVLGKTGMMFNMSGVAGTQTGLNEDGSLSFSPTESIDVNEAIQLRDEFPETAGLQCIGVSNDHIVALLRSDIIDYVIPYHVSGLNAGLRAMANIHGWDDFTSTQHAAIDKSIKLEDAVDKEHWREEPVFSEFFVGYDTGMTGIEAMRASAEKYKQMCKDRGLKPKFEQFAMEENYWKLLIDRKMINQKTGKLILQRAVTPTFDFGTIKEVVDRHVQNYDSGLEARALNHIVENWDSIPKRIKDLKKQVGKKAKKASKAVDTLANQTLAAQPNGVEQGERSYSLPTSNPDIRYSLPKGDTVTDSFNPMARVISGMKQDRMYADSVVSMLRGKGVKDEDIGQSGIEVWLEGKTYVTKDELTRFAESCFVKDDVTEKVYDIRWNKAQRHKDLVEVGEMPNLYNKLFGLTGKVYVSNEHLYQNMVSKAEAESEGRHRKDESTDYHELGEEKVISAIMGFQNPIAIMESLNDFKEPRLVSILDEKGNDKNNLLAVLELYTDKTAYGVPQERNHVLFTIYEKSSLPDYVKATADVDRVLYIRKGASADTEASLQLAGAISKETLENNLAQFIKKIKAFREKNHIDYKLPIGEDTSPRALLANAFEGIITNDIEKRKIQEYKGKVEMLNEEEKKLSELRAQIKELSFAKGKRDTKKIRELQFDANHTANRIATLDKMLLGLEASAPLQSILKREKEMAYKRGLEKNREKNKTARQQVIETREKRYAREKLQKLVIDTAKWISYPSKTDVKCPDILKQPYADFLNGIDLSSKRLAAGGDPTKNDLRLTNAMDSLATALDRVMASQDPNQDTTAVLDTGYLDLPAGFVQKLRDMTESVKAMMVEGDFVVNTMTAAEVRQLSQMIRTLNHAIREVSTLYANLRFANVEALGDETMSFIDALGEIEKSSGMKDFVQWENALPYYAFKRFGNGGESIFEGLMDAQDKLAYLAQQIFGFSEKTWTDKEAKAWSEDTHTIDLPDGDTLTLTTADAMSIYCLSRREQGLKHLLGGGARVVGIQKGSQKAQDSRSLLTVKDIDAIISSLTDRQKQVAEAVQEFMSTTCSEWGNEISMKRFLTKEFNEKFYFPIESNDENLPTKDPSAQQSDLFRLLNISATKPIDPRANNEVIVRNIFDVFTGHASDMARLNAYGMALLDYMKWLNYREKSVNDEGQVKVRGVRKSMEKAYGNAAKSYVLNLIKDVNGRASDGGDPSILMKWMRAAKTASVGSSLRVATLQITSYPRAALVLSPKNLVLGLSKLPKIEMAKKYCGIALWKSFGFYDTNIARSIEDQMKGVKDIKQKLIELSLKGAEWGDAITWGALWNACEYEVAATKKFKVGSEEFYQEVGKKLREVVYSTQVVDSTLTRSQIMRSKRGMAQEAAAFMSEPTLSANILMGAGFQFEAEKRRTGSAKAAWKNTGKLVGRAVAVYSIGQLTAALLEGLWDAWRDEEDEKFGEKYLNAFVENLALDLVPFNKIPIVSDVFEAALAMFNVGFYSSDKMSTTWLTQAVSAVDAWKDVLSGDSSATAYNALYKTMRAASSYVGVSFSGAMREVVAAWNNTAGAYDITWKIRTWDLSKSDMAREALEAIIDGKDRQAASLKAKFEDEESYHSAMRTAIKDRYNAGELDYETALEYLIKHSDMEEDEAFWKVEEWKHDSQFEEDFGKYNEFFGAVKTGKDLKAIIKKYTDNGVTDDTLRGQITDHFKPLYIEMSTAEKANIKGYLLNAMTVLGMKREDAEKKISAWEFESNSGFDYENRRELFLKGEITGDQVRNAIMTFGGKTAEEADKEVDMMIFEAEYGFAYSDRGDAYKSGDITAKELKHILMTAGGKTAEEADLQIQAYDWEKQGHEDVTMAAVREYNEYCSAASVPKDVYLHIRSFANNTDNDVDAATGKTIYYSAMKKIMAEINAQHGLTAAQKTAIARSLGWADKNINKYKPW